YVANMFGANHLYVNQGDGTFAETTSQALSRTSWGAIGCRFFDGNGDEYPDLYVVDMHSDMWVHPENPQDVRATLKFDNPSGPFGGGGGKPITRPEDTRAQTVLFGNTYFENDGDGTFTERSGSARLENWWPWGIAVGDFNDDGTQDVFVASGMGYPYFYSPNHLYLNDGQGAFHEAAEFAGIEPPAAGRELRGQSIKGIRFQRSSRSAAVADFDADGDLDIVANNFNHEPYLYRNDTDGGNAVRIRLRGTAAAHDAFGTRVEVRTPERTWHRRLAGAEGYLTQSEAVVHVGLGDVDTVNEIAVYWPGQTEPQIVPSPSLDEVVEIVQP
ncbi:MAG TPA: CRTAC1 family protein, partial [bacterium]|nr:CRTAC1 family protein [bacterium]